MSKQATRYRNVIPSRGDLRERVTIRELSRELVYYPGRRSR
jgi:hypothetical protein